jgi:hypothetical protein
MTLRVGAVIMFLVCMVTSAGWLTTRWELQAAQMRGSDLEASNGQYAYSVEEVSRLAKIANGQVMLTNHQIKEANTSIGQLKQKLSESENSITYWRQRVQPREFESLDELRAWLAKDDTDNTLYIFGSGCLGTYDCDDYAVALVYNAFFDGYSISLQVEGDHMLNSTIIGNNIYFIEPQNDKVWLWGYRD